MLGVGINQHLKKRYAVNKVSVVVATRNEVLNIENCLKSLRGQLNIELEIIVVDNNSVDETREVAGNFADKVFNLVDEIDLTEVKNFRGAQVNFGVSCATGSIIFFPDADMTFDPGLLNECATMLQEFDALYIPEVICGLGYFGKIRAFERDFYNATCIDALRVVKKISFDKVGGFDVHNILFGPDDWDLTKKLHSIGVKTGLTKKRIFHHEERLSLSTYIEKKAKYTPTLEGYINKWGSDDPDISRQLGIGYRYFGVFLENSKWKRLIARLDLAIGMYFLRFIVGVAYIIRRH